jgi:hypothetical protein
MQADHAPLGEIAFRCETYELLNSAAYLWAESTTAPLEQAEVLSAAAQWYEAFACTLDEVRSLPTWRGVTR